MSKLKTSFVRTEFFLLLSCWTSCWHVYNIDLSMPLMLVYIQLSRICRWLPWRFSWWSNLHGWRWIRIVLIISRPIFLVGNLIQARASLALTVNASPMQFSSLVSRLSLTSRAALTRHSVKSWSWIALLVVRLSDRHLFNRTYSVF